MLICRLSLNLNMNATVELFERVAFCCSAVVRRLLLLPLGLFLILRLLDCLTPYHCRALLPLYTIVWLLSVVTEENLSQPHPLVCSADLLSIITAFI